MTMRETLRAVADWIDREWSSDPLDADAAALRILATRMDEEEANAREYAKGGGDDGQFARCELHLLARLDAPLDIDPALVNCDASAGGHAHHLDVGHKCVNPRPAKR